MKKFTAILIAISIFLAQISVINAQEFVSVAGNYVDIDMKNGILYVSSHKCRVHCLRLRRQCEI